MGKLVCQEGVCCGCSRKGGDWWIYMGIQELYFLVTTEVIIYL